LTDIVKRLRAYITSSDDEVAPINVKADYMLIEEAAARIEKLEAALAEIAEPIANDCQAIARATLAEPIEKAADSVSSNHRDHRKDDPDLDVGC
jgi:hypothetical protein